jgi:hypothetical protein
MNGKKISRYNSAIGLRQSDCGNRIAAIALRDYLKAGV